MAKHAGVWVEGGVELIKVTGGPIDI